MYGSKGYAGLKRYGVNSILTAYDPSRADEHGLMKRFNMVLTPTAMELRGVFCLLLLLESPVRKKSSMSSMSFRKLVEDFELLRQVISTYAAESAAKMRREGLACSSVVGFLETNRFMDEPQYNPSIRGPLPYATDYTGEIIQAALAGLQQMFHKGYRYNKGGVTVEGLIPVSERQTSLLDPYDRDKVAGLMAALNIMNTIYGPGILRYGSQGFRNAKWQMRQNHLSTDNSRGLMTDHQQMKRIFGLGQSKHLIRAL